MTVGVRSSDLLLERDCRRGIEERDSMGELLRVLLGHLREDHGRLIKPPAARLASIDAPCPSPL